MADKAEFLKTIEEAVETFPKNGMCRLLESEQFSMSHYHSILQMIFHQTFQGPSTFALAGAHCDLRLHEVRDYLLHHADEEKSHWQWVISDLRKTGYTGPDPKDTFPETACQAYIAFNVYTAVKFPLARLAIAAVLESIGANYGKKYATLLCRQLKLKPEQALFFYGHGDTDVGHTQDIINVIDKCELSEYDWRWMVHSARTAGKLYTAMYDEAAMGEHVAG